MTPADSPTWATPPAAPRLAGTDVHIWQLSSIAPASGLSSHRNFLSPDENERADRFRFDDHRAEYVITRASLRAILGRYLNRAPAQIQFSYTSYGKPLLAGESAKTGLQFNVSHSSGIALIAVAASASVGVDVENHHRKVDIEGLAPRYFSRGESAAIAAAPVELKSRTFFRCWTRKEAWIKARGCGLSLPLSSFEISMDSSAPPRLVWSAEKMENPESWSFLDLEPAENYIGAVATQAASIRHFLWKFTE